MRHVWIVNHYAQEPGNGGGTRHFDLAKNLPKFGWSASIIAAGTEHNTGRQRLNGEPHRLDDIQGVPFLWLKTPKYTRNGFARLANMLAFAVRSVLTRATKDLQRPDAIVGSSVHPFAGLAGYILAKRFRVPFFFEVRDLWPETLIDMGAITRNGVSAKIFRFIEGFLYRRAHRVITPLPLAHNYICRFGISREKVIWIPNGVDFSRFMRIDPAPDRRPFTLMYFGAHGAANGLSNVIEAMKQVAGSDIRLRLVGDGPNKRELVAQANGAPNVIFEDPIPKDRIPLLAAEADAFVFNLVNAPVFRYGVSPQKLSDFMAAGRPVIFACDAPNNPIEDAKAGITVPPGDPSRLAEAIKSIASMPNELRNEMGQRGRNYALENLSTENISKKLARTLVSYETNQQIMWSLADC